MCDWFAWYDRRVVALGSSQRINHLYVHINLNSLQLTSRAYARFHPQG